MLKKNVKAEDNVINIEAGMKGTLTFNTPVNLKISGNFEGELETKGTLIIAETADVNAKIIRGENIIVLGEVKGDIVCSQRLELSPPAKVIGNITAPTLVVNEGAMLKGRCQVPMEVGESIPKKPSKKKK